jgi:MoaA/NifB/PqqE/SkfB family radical SAM enzyme
MVEAYDRNKVLTFYGEYLQMLRSGVCFPRMALLYPTRICNQSCYYCSDAGTNSGFAAASRLMPKDKMFALLPGLENLGVASIEYCGGGEPTLHPDFKEFTQEAYDQGFKQGTLTNGTMMTGDLARQIIDTFSYVRISIDSFDSYVYDSIRRPKSSASSLDSVVSNIRELVALKKERKSKCLVTIKACFDSSTIAGMADYINQGIHLGVDGINIRVVRNSDKELSEEQIKAYSTVLDFYKEKTNADPNGPTVFGGLGNSRLETQKCLACAFHIFIDTNGDVRHCCYYQDRESEHTYGNAFEGNIEDIWWSETHLESIAKIDPAKCNWYNCKYHGYNNRLYHLIEEDAGQLQFT